jgi:hypothetical protein
MPVAITTVIGVLQLIVQNLPGAITTAQQLYDLGTKLYTTISGKAPTADEQDQLEAQIDADVIDALSPLPPAQPGDPDYVPPTS